MYQFDNIYKSMPVYSFGADNVFCSFDSSIAPVAPKLTWLKINAFQKSRRQTANKLMPALAVRSPWTLTSLAPRWWRRVRTARYHLQNWQVLPSANRTRQQSRTITINVRAPAAFPSLLPKPIRNTTPNPRWRRILTSPLSVLPNEFLVLEIEFHVLPLRSGLVLGWKHLENDGVCQQTSSLREPFTSKVFWVIFCLFVSYFFILIL